MHCVAPVILISAFVGCKRDEVKVYRTVQEEPPQKQSAPVQQWVTLALCLGMSPVVASGSFLGMPSTS